MVPGEFFFFGLDEAWDHSHQCLRINIAQPHELVREGIRRIAEVVREAASQV